MDIDGDHVVFNEEGTPCEKEFMPGDTTRSEYPGWLYTIGRNPKRMASSYDPLLAYNLPVHANAYHAIADWAEIRDFHYDSDARLCSTLAFLPECRARFSMVQRIANGLDLKVEGRSANLSAMRVKGLWEHMGTTKHFEAQPGEDTMHFEIPKGAARIEVYLIGSDNTLYDYRKEDRVSAPAGERFADPAQDEGTNAMMEAIFPRRGGNS